MKHYRTELANIKTAKRLHISQIEGVPTNLVEFIENDCRESFRLTLTTYFGDAVQGVISVENLGAWLEETDFENVSAKVLSWLRDLFNFADDHEIDEITFG